MEKHELTSVLLEAINAHLKTQGLLVSKGTMVDTTLIHAPSSTKNFGDAGYASDEYKRGSRQLGIRWCI
ncbi:hypothetical protein [Nitrosomonas sp. Is35]|uniref:hypothetical protein n=1 Tax=Nitrosomonas sp. Is35 TaxID=3080534 RepID=UPI0039827FC1